MEKYVVQKTKREVPGVVTLSLAYENGSVPKHRSGQYINIFFKDASTPEGKAYSISSAPDEETFKITVRDIGEFSNKLCNMKKGDVINATLPYGFFRPENSDTNLIMLAAGIGVTPFRSIIRNAVACNQTRKINLFHSIRNSEDAIFDKEFLELSRTNKNFSTTRFVTRENTPKLRDAIKGRIDIQKILKCVQSDTHTEFLICGSVPFTRDLWKTLVNNGVSEDYIYTEAFFSH